MLPTIRANPTIADAARVLESIAPTSLAQSWDNVGLLVGDRAAHCRRVLLCIDLTPAVLTEGTRWRCNLVVAYHPPLFQPVTRVLAASKGTDAIVHRAIAAGIAIYSPHTALDAADGGTNDIMAGFCSLTDVEPFEYLAGPRHEAKVVTFVPRPQLEELSAAMFAAGAGRIGDYAQCSFRLEGTGTFFGTESTHPRVGRKGHLEQVDEVRVEMVAPTARLPEVIAALRRVHPYEEPAIDVYPLTPEPVRGIGRVGRLPTGTTLGKLARQLKKATGSRVMTIVGAPATKIRRAAVCVGAAGRLPLEKPRSADSDAIVTGEIRHHDALTLLRYGRCAIALGHWESERPALKPLAARLHQELPSVKVLLSRADAPPFTRYD